MVRPFTFEPPQPVRPDISVPYGALQQENVDWQRKFELAKLQGQWTQANLHQAGGGGGGGGGGGFRGDQPSMLGPGQATPTQLGAQRFEQQLGLQNNQAANQQTQQQAFFSQSEALRLQRMQQADSYLDQQSQPGRIMTPD